MPNLMVFCVVANLLDKTRTSTIFVLPAQLLSKVLGLLYVVLLARGLTVDDYGIYNFIVGGVLVFSYLSNFGLGSSLQRFLPEYAELRQYTRIVRTILVAHVFRTILSLASLLAAIIYFQQWAEFFSIDGRQDEFIVFAVGAFILFQVEYLQIEFNALFMHKAVSIIQVFYTLLKYLLVFMVFEAGFGLIEVLAAEAISYAAGLGLLIYIFVTRVLPRRPTSGEDKDSSFETKRLARYSGFNALVAPGGILYSNSMDYFVIAAMANPFDLGIYALASRAAKMLTSVMPQNLLQSIIRPAFYQRYYAVSDKKEELNTLFGTLVNLIAAVLIPALVIVILSATPLISVIFGEKYDGADKIFVLLLVFNIFTVLEFTSDLVLQAIEKVQARLYAQVFAVYNVIAAIILMKYIGIIGVAFATGSALMFKCLFYYYMANRYTGISIPWGSLGRIAINSLPAGVATYGILRMGDSPLYLVTAIIVGGVVYILATWMNNFMDVREKKLVNVFLKRQIFNV